MGSNLGCIFPSILSAPTAKLNVTLDNVLEIQNCKEYVT